MKSPSQRWRCLRVALTCFAVVVASGYLDRNNRVYDGLEQASFALRMSCWTVRNREVVASARKRVVLVPISDETFTDPAFASLGEPVIPRLYEARVLRDLRQAGARVVAFDILFDLPRPGDDLFATVARKYGGVVWGCAWDDTNKKMLMPTERLLAANPYHGHARWPQSGAIASADRLEVAVNASGKEIPALSIETARLALGIEKRPLTRAARSWRCGDLVVPVAGDGAFRISFFGAPGIGGALGDTFAVVPFEQVYNGATHDAMEQSTHFFRDKIVLIGDITALNRDFCLTPVGRMSGLEVHAHAVATLLERSFLRAPPPYTEPMALILLAAATTWLAVSRRWLPAVWLTALLISGYCLLAVVLFTDWNLVLPVAAPVVTAFVASLAAIIERGWVEERERGRITLVLSQYVSEQVSLHGPPTGEVALLFTDIEGSTQMSRRFGERFERVRDEHFRILRGAAQLWNGFEVETAGDSIYLVFGTAADAVRFAIDAQRDLRNHAWPPVVGQVRVRMGVHFGHPFVGRDRGKLTYRGPDTNRTARVMASAHGGQVLVTEALRRAAAAALPANISFLDCGEFSLKGIGEEELYQVCHPDLPTNFS